MALLIREWLFSSDWCDGRVHGHQRILGLVRLSSFRLALQLAYYLRLIEDCECAA